MEPQLIFLKLVFPFHACFKILKRFHKPVAAGNLPVDETGFHAAREKKGHDESQRQKTDGEKASIRPAKGGNHLRRFFFFRKGLWHFEQDLASDRNDFMTFSRSWLFATFARERAALAERSERSLYWAKFFQTSGLIRDFRP